MKALPCLVAIMAVALVAVALAMVSRGSDGAYANPYVLCPTSTAPTKTPGSDPTKTASPTGTPCYIKATATPTPTDTPTPTPAVVIVGGVAELPDVADLPLETAASSGGNAGVLVGVLAAATVGGVAIGGAAWYLRRRRAG